MAQAKKQVEAAAGEEPVVKLSRVERLQQELRVAEEKQQQVIDRVLEMDLKSVADQLVADAIHQADEQYQEAERKGKAIEAARNG